MDTQPKIPTLKDSQKPQVKIRGLEAGVTLFDRLKQFKKKDLAFILAGLGTLFMAPLAEHFMMSPESGDGQLQQGWGKGAGAKGMFDGSGSSPYEPGANGFAPGNAVGGGSDIITPLNVRDPSALVMGPGATQQPPTQSVMPSTPPPTAPVTHSESDLRDALAAGGRGVSAAARAAKALLPVPKIALAGSGGLRGLGVVSGGTSATAGGGGISSNGLVGNRANVGGGMAGVRGGNNIKSVSRSATGGGSGGLDALKAAAGNAADSFNNKGAYQGATDAAATQIPAGGSALGGGGAGGVGATDKPFGGDQNKDGKNVGESLAFLKQKAMQEAQIALWAKEQEAGDNRLEALKIRNSMAEAFTSKLAGMAADQMGCLINSQSNPNCPTSDASVSTYYCTPAGGGAPVQIPASIVAKNIGKCLPVPGGKDGAGATSGKVYYPTGSGLAVCPNGGTATPYAQCTTNLGGSPDGAGNTPKTPNDMDTSDTKILTDGRVNKELGDMCGKFKTAQTQSPQADVKSYYATLLNAAAVLETARDKTYYGTSSSCAGAVTIDQAGTAAKLIADGSKTLTDAAGQGGKSPLDQIKDAVTLDKLDKMPCKDAECKTAAQKWSAANGIIQAQVQAADSGYTAALTNLKDPNIADTNLINSYHASKAELDKVQGAVKLKLGDVSKASDQLKQGLQMLGVVVGQIDPAVAVNKGPTLKQVVDQNASYEQKSGYQVTAPAPAPANGGTTNQTAAPTGPTAMSPVPQGSLAEAVQKYNTANTAAPIQVTAPPAGTADKGGNVDGSITKAGTDITSIATDVQTVNAAVTAKTPVTAAQLTNFATAGTSLSSMQLTQAAQIDTIKGTLPDPASLPQPNQ